MLALPPSVVELTGLTKKEVESNIKSRISKRHSLFLTSTRVNVIHEERLFIGVLNKDESVTVSRYRQYFHRITPKIYTTWTLEERGKHLSLHMRHRISRITLLVIALVVGTQYIGAFSGSAFHAVYFIQATVILAIAVALLVREKRKYESILTRIAQEPLSTPAG